MQYATQTLLSATLELGGKSPNIFADVMDEEDAFSIKRWKALHCLPLNQWRSLQLCPSCVLVQEPIYERFMERAIRRVESIRSGNPLDSVTQMARRLTGNWKPSSTTVISVKKKGALMCSLGGGASCWKGELKDGYYLEPTIFVWSEQYARVPRFWPGAGGNHLQNDGRSAGAGERYHMARARASGAATVIWPIRWGAAFRPGACGPTVITLTRHMRRLAAANNQALARNPQNDA